MTACSAKATDPNVDVVPPVKFQTMMNDYPNGYLLDVRQPDEYAAGHLKGAHLLNWLDTDSFKKKADNIDKNKTIYVYCRSGRRSNEAATYLAGQGYKVIDMDGGILAWEKDGLHVVTDDSASKQIEAQGIIHDTFTTPAGRDVKIHFIKHASLILDIAGQIIYIDPTEMFGNDFSKLPKADAVMVTHEHHDHYDPKAIEAVSTPDTHFICNGRVAELARKGEIMIPGNTLSLPGISITATPAYNTTEGHLQFHPRDRKDVGYIYDIDGLRIYVAGDTEDIPELACLKDIDIAFFPVNQPFTMTPGQAIHAIEMVRPKIAYPYHYGETDISPIIEAFSDNDSIDIRIRELQ